MQENLLQCYSAQEKSANESEGRRRNMFEGGREVVLKPPLHGPQRSPRGTISALQRPPIPHRYRTFRRLDFMEWPQLFKHGYKHICNMVCYFSGALYPYPTFGTKTEDAKQAFQYHQGSGHPMPAAVYWDVGSAFMSSEMKTMLNSLNIIAIQGPSQSRKSVGMIERANMILSESIPIPN